MRWTQYALPWLVFNLLGLLVVYALQPLAEHFAVKPTRPPGCHLSDSAFNTAVSFTTEHQLAGLRRRNYDEAT